MAVCLFEHILMNLRKYFSIKIGMGKKNGEIFSPFSFVSKSVFYFINIILIVLSKDADDIL